MKTNFKKTGSLKKFLFCAFCCTITCVLSMITINIGIVPISLATVGVYFSGGLLGGLYGALSQLLYLILVFIGFPFTASFRGGFSVFAGPTGGFLIGYVFTSMVAGFLYENLKKMFNIKQGYIKKMVLLEIACILATFVCYGCGLLWFLIVMKVSLMKAITVCVIPFILVDFLKINLVSFIVVKLESILNLN